jgi:hypothetical protein
LPVLEALTKTGTLIDGWENIAFVCVQHILPTTLSLFDALFRLGTKPGNIYLLGKNYSTHYASKQLITHLGIRVQNNSVHVQSGYFSEIFSKDIKNFWDYISIDLTKKRVNAIIILDEGGHCLASTPENIVRQYAIVGIEQTVAGLLNPKVPNLQYPLIDVATSAAKKWLEPPIISKAIIRKFQYHLQIRKSKLSCGVAGFGSIGKALANELSIMGHAVTVYDIMNKNRTVDNRFQWCRSFDELISVSDYIFGCSGMDVTKEFDINSLPMGNKYLTSCSSEDREFQSLLRFIQRNKSCESSPLDDIVYENKNRLSITICRGGFPINFDNSSETEPPMGIQLTRGLILGAIIQALSMLNQSKRNYHAKVSLDMKLQRFIAKKWSRYQYRDSHLKRQLNHFKDANWICNNSGGIQNINENLYHLVI